MSRENFDQLLAECQTTAPGRVWRSIGNTALALGRGRQVFEEDFFGNTYKTKLTIWSDENGSSLRLDLRQRDDRNGRPASLTVVGREANAIDGMNPYNRYMFYPDILREMKGMNVTGGLIVFRGLVDTNAPPDLETQEAQIAAAVWAGEASPELQDVYDLNAALVLASPNNRSQ